MFELDLSNSLAQKRRYWRWFILLLMTLTLIIIAWPFRFLEGPIGAKQSNTHAPQQVIKDVQPPLPNKGNKEGDCFQIEKEYTLLGVVFDQVRAFTILKQKTTGKALVIGLGSELNKGFQLVSTTLQGALFKRLDCEAYLTLKTSH